MKRIDVLKTYKIFIGGKFPRTESGRYSQIKDDTGELLANICISSRKDFRNAVVSARKIQKDWSKLSAINRGQVLYRIGELLESRKLQFIEELMRVGRSRRESRKEVEESIDRLIYYAGWSDKYQQIFSSVNPVASSHFNFSVQQAMGVVSIISPNSFSLLGLVCAYFFSICFFKTTSYFHVKDSNSFPKICFKTRYYCRKVHFRKNRFR